MSQKPVRVWVEEADSTSDLLFTWKMTGDFEPTNDDGVDPMTAVADQVEALDGVVSARMESEGLRVSIDPERITRYDVAATIRRAFGVEEPKVQADARVWAEDLASNRLRITWEQADFDQLENGERDETRRTAAWLAAMPGVRSATVSEHGVLVVYDPGVFEREEAGSTVRSALADQTPIRERADDLLRRAPTYGNLARKLALDDRISPLPGAAKQAVVARGTGGRNVAVRTAMRFVPGAALISRVQTLLPMLSELSEWSRETDPAIVEGHLSDVGLSREIIAYDTVTAHEIRLYARHLAADRSSEVAERAAIGAKQAIDAGRKLIARARDSVAEEAESPHNSDGSRPEHDGTVRS